ncbi:MAG TPA: caspase family protein [Terriglobia bacterium]|nr:caspase family protein [Terriglobia bacterium]
MKPLVLDDSPRRRSYSKVAVILIILVSVSFTLFNTSSLAADEPTSKAVRRSSSESGVSIKDQRRVALIIGNSDYKVAPLRNPAHDAEDISGVLRTLGFAVQTKTNVNHLEMEEAVNKFVQEIQNGDVALFYFSGHGVQVRGENYLIPLGSPIRSEADVRFKTLNAGLVLAKTKESRNRANIVILDACRNNPFKGLFRSPGTGLSKMDAPKGTFIAYAASPDSVAADGTERNSPYTKHLMEALKVQDIPIEQALKLVAKAVNKETGGQQTPWILSSLLDDFYCNPSSPTRPHEASLPAPTPPQPVSAPSSEYREKAERLGTLWAARGDAATQGELSGMYKGPEGGKWLRQAGQQGDPVAQLLLGRMFAQGLEAPKDEREAVKWYKKAADQGNSSAQTNLGLMYQNGSGVPKDYDEAIKWYRKAADQGNALAQSNLGVMYRDGLGVAKDYGEALEWFKKAADQGNAHGQNGLGFMYQNGFGVAKDYDEAVKWYKKAAEQGGIASQNSLGLMYKNGWGVAKDYDEAVKWYRKAAEQGNATAQGNLGVMYRDGLGVAKDYGEAVKWYKKAAEQGNADAQNNLGVMYKNGTGVAKDYGEAVKWYKKAAEQGNADAQNNLGVMYKNGTGVKKDRTEAIKWYKQAADQGNEHAKKELKKLGAAVK